jgi:hypothetical protein
MICVKCQGDSLADCKCPDLLERLEGVKDHFVIDAVKKDGKVYAAKCGKCGQPSTQVCKCQQGLPN